jgi:hypothetical protein
VVEAINYKNIFSSGDAGDGDARDAASLCGEVREMPGLVYPASLVASLACPICWICDTAEIHTDQCIYYFSELSNKPIFFLCLFLCIITT